MPDLEFARKFAEAVHAKHPGKILDYNGSLSFNCKKNLGDASIAQVLAKRRSSAKLKS